MPMLHQFFITLVALCCWKCAADQEMYIKHSGVLVTTTLDMDLNFTVADACQLLGQFHCILSERIYIHAGKCLTREYNDSVTT